MDVFYYWKNYDKDFRDGHIGWLKSDRKKLGSLRERYPTFIWAFQTPPGCKGKLKLVAKLVWSDIPKVALPKLEAASTIYYDPTDPHTAFYNEMDTNETIDAITTLLRSQFPSAFRANFRGDNGIQVMEGDFLRSFQKLVGGLGLRSIERQANLCNQRTERIL